MDDGSIVYLNPDAGYYLLGFDFKRYKPNALENMNMNDLRLLHTALLERKISFIKSIHSNLDPLQTDNLKFCFSIEHDPQRMAGETVLSVQEDIISQIPIQAAGERNVAQVTEDSNEKMKITYKHDIAASKPNNAENSYNKSNMPDITHQGTDITATSHRNTQGAESDEAKTKKDGHKLSVPPKDKNMGELKKGKSQPLQKQADAGANIKASKCSPSSAQCDSAETTKTGERLGTRMKTKDNTTSPGPSHQLQKSKNAKRKGKGDNRPKHDKKSTTQEAGTAICPIQDVRLGKATRK
ncbi:hypothetical protein BCR43DRAFT_31967 [Syncephalastrum racemosum]|uniref:Uncharacterized protein n=1 Tax=Syncephalastrum racemosum TaxID=13706 RepID=A0A1X2HTT6_SYNRA|nr:hypothetical protein BCR43DRAFT_31967 [Syncephalastrum racemosum]